MEYKMEERTILIIVGIVLVLAAFSPLIFMSNDNEYNYTDYCVSNATLMEYLCSGDKSANSIYDCTTNGTTSCYDGACI